MNRYTLLKTFSWLLFFFAILTTGIAPKGYGQEDVAAFRHDMDSLSILVNQCNTDTSKFRILYNYFWRYFGYDLERDREVGEWAYNVIKDTKNPRLLADSYDVKGVLFEKDGNYDSAYIVFNKALELSKKAGYHSRMLWCYYHLGIIHTAKGNADSALYYYKTLYRFNNDNISYSPSKFYVYRQIALLFNDQYDQPDSAEKYFNKMLYLSRETGDAQKEIEAYTSLMNFYYKTNQVKKLLETINVALVIAEENNHDKALLFIYNMIGDMFLVNKKNYDIALLYYKKVLEICRPEYKQWEAIILNDIGDLYLKMGNDSLAFIYVNEGFKVAQIMNLKHQLSESYRNLGKIYKFRGRLQEAVGNFEECYNTGCDECPKVVFHQALIDIADSYMEIQNPDKALAYYKESLDLAKESNANIEQAVSNLRLGNYYSIHNTGAAKFYYESALQQAKLSNDLRIIKDVADTLSSYYRKHFDYKAAYDYQMLVRTIEDSISKMENQASLADLELKFEIEKINKENKLNEQLSLSEIKRQKTFRNGALLIASLIVILGTVVYLSYRRKKKDNQLLEKLSSELHHADEMKLRFFANVSHELLTPLTLILNPAKSLLESAPAEGDQKRYLENIYKNAVLLRDLTNQIMELQKLDAGKLKLNEEEADIVEYCIGVASSFESLCFKKNNQVAIRSNCKSVVTFFDKDKIGKILGNLLSNAFKFCFEGSVIELNIEIFKNFFKFSVTDHGIGIPEEDISQIFKQYYQASTNNVSGGSGIGLAYVRELSAFMKGKAEIESVVQKGTKVTVTLPLASYSAIDESFYELVIPKSKPAEIKEIVIADDLKVDQNMALIVEDNDELRGFIGNLLKPDYNLILACNGLEGTKAAFKYLPDIIISDVMMPGMNGFEMCAMLKKDERTSHIPVLLLTAKDGAQSYKEGYMSGADDYIIKPFDSDLLKLKIRNIIATTEASRKQFDLKSMLPVDSCMLGNVDKEFMKKCLSVIEKHVDDSSFSVDDLAGEVSFSNRNFYRKIKAITNQTPAELIRVYRLHYAKQLLQNTDMKVFEIAMAVGYEDVNRFRQAYKKLFGFPPSESINNVMI